MVWPDGHDFTPDDIIQNIQYLKPVSDFRTKYDYDNLLYIIAGVVIERVSGKYWTDFIEENFIQPLNMNRTAASWNTLKDRSNVIVPHVPIDGELKVVDRYRSEEHTSELQSRGHLVCRLLLEKKNTIASRPTL